MIPFEHTLHHQTGYLELSPTRPHLNFWQQPFSLRRVSLTAWNSFDRRYFASPSWLVRANLGKMCSVSYRSFLSALETAEDLFVPWHLDDHQYSKSSNRLVRAKLKIDVNSSLRIQSWIEQDPLFRFASRRPPALNVTKPVSWSQAQLDLASTFAKQ